MRPIGLVVLFVAAVIAGPACRFSSEKEKSIATVASTPEEQTAVTKRLDTFLRAIDADGDTWSQLASSMRSSTPETTWAALVKAMKATTGKVIKRQNIQMAYTEALPDAPPGRYAIVDIDAECARINVSERVVFVSEDQTWKVAGYFRSKSVHFGNDEKKP